MNTPEIKKARGGQTKDPFERLRIILWHKDVRRRTDLEDPSLDDMFLWHDPNEYLQHGAQKVFERIGKFGMYPRGKGDGSKRNLPEIVEAVDQHPDFQGTAIVFSSKLWELLRLKSISEAEVIKRIDEVFTDHGIQRRPLPAREESWRLGRNPDLDVQHPVNIFEFKSLRDANLHKITWVYLDLLFYFFVQTTISRNNKRMFDLHTDGLKKYFEEGLGELGQRCSEEALQSIRNAVVMRIF